MILLDTDHISLMQWGSSDGDRIRSRLQAIGLAESPPITIITYEEQMRGWMDKVKNAKTVSKEIELYAKLKGHILYSARLTIFDYTEKAAVEFQRLRGMKIRIGTMDLKIAAIALANDATLWTRNMVHFTRVPGNAVNYAARFCGASN